MTDAAMASDDLRVRNRRLVRVLLMIMATLIVGSLLVGIRW
jgi:hypothetical protein